MNATSLYVSTCRLILQANSDDPSSWLNIFKIFPSLRRSLSCTVCGKLLIEPYTPSDSTCQHHVCRTCKGGKKLLKPSCSWCKDYEKYLANVQLRCLLQSYKRLCMYLKSCNIYRLICTFPNSSNFNHCNNILDNGTKLSDLINEGSCFRDDFSNRQNGNQLNNLLTGQKPSRTIYTQTNPVDKTERKKVLRKIRLGPPSYSVVSNDSGSRLTFKRTATKIKMTTIPRSRLISNNKPLTKVNKIRKRLVFTKPPTCKCGVEMKNKGSCRGYRCPCYSADKSCLDCGCIGCKNPRGTSLNEESLAAENGESSRENPSNMLKKNSDEN